MLSPCFHKLGFLAQWDKYQIFQVRYNGGGGSLCSKIFFSKILRLCGNAAILNFIMSHSQSGEKKNQFRTGFFFPTGFFFRKNSKNFEVSVNML